MEGTCEYDEISFLWLCYLKWQKGDYPIWAWSDHMSLLNLDLEVRQEVRDVSMREIWRERNSPAGFEDEGDHVARTQKWPLGAEGIP